ncbi:hypothetical protein B566_EDAN005874 [Ephemera danica]|nr:hypothetical protein B566_EDAN005874 [Ephemera danica]
MCVTVVVSGEPVSWLFLSPSVSPWRPPSDSSNPGLRLYKFDTDTGQVLDYTQFYLDLNHANQHDKAEWQPEYNLTSHYGLSDVSPRSLHRLAESFRSLDDTELFERYVRANTVSLTPGTSSSHGSSLGSTSHSCRERSCQHVHYCAITRLGYPEYRRCLSDEAVWSGASSSSSSCLLVLVVLLALVRQR